MSNQEPVNSIKVRMYRQGFGDCFLLSFFHDDDRIFTMLIDCGIKYNSKSDDVPIEDVIGDLTTTLTPDGGGKPKLDVLIATHEHWDHIAFFHPTRSPDFFADFEIGQVWLGWTENPDDDEAKVINSRLRDGVAALAFAAERLKEAEDDEVQQSGSLYFGGDVATARSEFNQAIDDMMGFYGVSSKKKVSDSGIKYKENGRISTLTQQAMENIIKLGGGGRNVRYFSPGTTVDRSLIPQGINIYVLGPPKSSLINKSNPSRGHAHETYLGIDQSGMTSFIDGALGMGAADGDAKYVDGASPFGPDVGIEAAQAEEETYFSNTYFAAEEEYRKIENNWLDVTGQFALQLDGAINNTSLVLAIEFTDSKKVLLFPGDAQVGSWLSWHDWEWKVKNGSQTEIRSAEDLLNNTVLYKVSHHGSHNATLRDKGLEMMTHPDLVAIVPEQQDSYSGIPYDKLFKDENGKVSGRAYELCKGRVLFSADKNFPPEDLLSDQPRQLSDGEWNAFKDDLTISKHYVEYTVRSN